MVGGEKRNQPGKAQARMGKIKVLKSVERNSSEGFKEA